MLVREYRTRLRDILAEMNPEEANTIADLLLCAALETDRGTMLSVLDEEMSDESEEFCGKAIKELSYGKPIQYYDKHSKGSDAYNDIAKELIQRI